MKSLLQKLLVLFLLVTLLPFAAFLSLRTTGSRQTFRIYDAATSKTRTLSAREYVLGALCCEMPPTFHPEALKAQAVAIYTNALRSQSAGEETAAQVNSAAFEGYAPRKSFEERWGKSFSVYYEKMCAAVDSVLYKVITHDGKPILAAYHAMSSGKTESAENVWGQAVPYLVPVESEGDTFCEQYETTVTVTGAQVRQALAGAFEKVYLPEDNSLLLTEMQTSASGTVLSVMAGNVRTDGQKLRSLFSLRSASFTVALSGDNVTFTVHGYGHGVGLSQYGADFMARQGADFRAILAHYYTGTGLMEAA